MISYAVHGGDLTIIKIVEENSRLLTSNNLQLFFESAIEFFNTDAALYIQRKHPRSSKLQSSLKSIENYNFCFFPNSLSTTEFPMLCKKGYFGRDGLLSTAQQIQTKSLFPPDNRRRPHKWNG